MSASLAYSLDYHQPQYSVHPLALVVIRVRESSDFNAGNNILAIVQDIEQVCGCQSGVDCYFSAVKADVEKAFWAARSGLTDKKLSDLIDNFQSDFLKWREGIERG